MSLIKYTLSENHSRSWNTDWFLRVDTSETEGKPTVQILTSIPPGPKTQISGMMVANMVITFRLYDAEARLFVEAYSKVLP
jgi:hypothetical protein